MVSNNRKMVFLICIEGVVYEVQFYNGYEKERVEEKDDRI